MLQAASACPPGGARGRGRGEALLGLLLRDPGERGGPSPAVGMPPASLSLSPGQPAGDDPGDAVVGHRHPVEDVGGVHRPFLMGDDHELGTVGEAADQLQEAIDVGVIEGGLDLVEDVERAGPGEEDGEDEGQGDE